MLAAVSVACAGRVSTSVAPPPPMPQLASAPGLNVVLAWSAPVDLDLYLTDPSWETVYFANNPSRTGARLVRDTRCADVAAPPPFVESAQVLQPRPGNYRIGVDFIDACGMKREPVAFRVIVELGASRREITGTVRLEEFQPVVLEFALQQAYPEGPVTLVQEGS